MITVSRRGEGGGMMGLEGLQSNILTFRFCSSRVAAAWVKDLEALP